MRAFKKYVKAGEKFPSGKAASRKAIALPLYPELPARTAIFVAEKIREYYS
jgi:dTDP-4-amino-4,6-dideoxygalactose transaminase